MKKLNSPEAHDKESSVSSRRFVSPILISMSLVTLLGGLLRFKALTFQSLWADELLAAGAAARGFHGIIDSCSRLDFNPPIFHIFLWLWQKVFGISELSARTLPAIFGTLGIVALYFLGREIFSRRVGLWASLILAVNCFHLYYSQEVRPYALLVLLAMLSYLFYVRQVKNPGWKNSLLYVGTSTLLIYSHYFGLLVVASQAVLLCFTLPFPGWPKKGRFLKFQLPSFLALGLLYLPWIPHMLSLLPMTSSWTPKPQPGFFLQYFRDFFGPELFVAFGLTVLLLLFFMSRRRQGEYGHSKVLLLCWVFVVFFLPYFRSFGHSAPLLPRYAIAVLPALLLAAGRGLEEIKEAPVKLFLTLSLALMSLVGIFLTNGSYYRMPSKQQVRQATQYVIGHDPQKKYPVYGHALFGYYFNTIYRYSARVNVDLAVQPAQVEQLERQVKTGRIPGFWLLERSFADRMDSAAFLHLQRHLFPAASQDFLKVRATLFVGPEDFTVTSHKVRLPLPWLQVSGQAGLASADSLTLEPAASAAIPELGFSPGLYGLTLSAEAPASTQFRIKVEGDPTSYLVSPAGTVAEAMINFRIPKASRRRIVMESILPTGQASPAPGNVVIHNLWLQKIIPLSQFLSAALLPLEHKTVIITAGQKAKGLLRPPHLGALRQLGLRRIDEWMSRPTGVYYMAVLKNGRLVFERAGNAELIYQDKRLRIDAGNGKFQILVDGVDYAKSPDGLNFVVVDGPDVSSYFCRALWHRQLLVEQ
jgi:mannosyltransferase